MSSGALALFSRPVNDAVLCGQKGATVDEKKEVGRSSWALLARLAMTVAAVGMAVAFFLPWATAGDEFREAASSFPDVMYYEPTGMTVTDATDISLLEYAQVYASMENTSWQVYTVIMYAVLGASVLTILLAALSKPIGAALVGAVVFAGSRLLVWDFGDRGVLPSSTHDWGLAPTAYIAAFVVLVAAAVWMVVIKRGAKLQSIEQGEAS